MRGAFRLAASRETFADLVAAQLDRGARRLARASAVAVLAPAARDPYHRLWAWASRGEGMAAGEVEPVVQAVSEALLCPPAAASVDDWPRALSGADGAAASVLRAALVRAWLSDPARPSVPAGWLADLAGVTDARIRQLALRGTLVPVAAPATPDPRTHVSRASAVAWLEARAAARKAHESEGGAVIGASPVDAYAEGR